jgi:hypothetical protein
MKLLGSTLHIISGCTPTMTSTHPRNILVGPLAGLWFQLKLHSLFGSVQLDGASLFPLQCLTVPHCVARRNSLGQYTAHVGSCSHAWLSDAM